MPAASGMPFDRQARHEFHLKEFEMLRKEIEYRTDAQERTERNVFIGVLAVSAALSALDKYRLPGGLTDHFVYLWFLPFLIVLLGAARFLDDHAGIHALGRYIERLEVTFDPKAGGWQREYHIVAKTKWRWAWTLRVGAWLLYLAITLAVGIVAISYD